MGFVRKNYNQYQFGSPLARMSQVGSVADDSSRLGQAYRAAMSGGLRPNISSTMQNYGQVDVPRDQYGLARPLGTGNIQSASGVQPGVLGSNWQSGNNQTLGYLGRAAVMDQGGKRVVMGGQAQGDYQRAIASGANPQDAIRMAQQSAQQRYRESPQFQAQVKRAGQAREAMVERQNSIRERMRQVRGLPLSNPVSLSGAGQGVANPSSPTPIAPDTARWNLEAAGDLGGMLGDIGLSGYQSLGDVDPRSLVNAMRNPNYGKLEGQADLDKAIRSWMVRNPNNPYQSEIDALLNRDQKTADRLRQRRDAENRDLWLRGLQDATIPMM